MTVLKLIELMKRDGSRLAQPIPMGDLDPMTFTCSFDPEDASPQEIQTLNTLCCQCPKTLTEFWSIARTARLFEDQSYGQWGLELLRPRAAAEATAHFRKERTEYVQGDLIIGRFLGDCDLLLVRFDSSTADYGQVLVALPTDGRPDWSHVGLSFGLFLETYVSSAGKKFWEP